MAEERLRATLVEIAEENKYVDYLIEITPITSDGANYTSKLFTATISARNLDKLNLFAKVSNVSEDMRNLAGHKSIFDTEVYFYTKLHGVYEALEEKHRVPDENTLVVPKFYKCNPKRFEEVLVLENLAIKGFSSYNRMTSITWEYATAAVKQLAKLHALSFAYKEENPEEFAEVAKSLPFLMGDEQNGDIFITKAITAALEVLKEEYKERLTDFFKKQDISAIFFGFFKTYFRNVLIHSDYRQSNLMHRNKNGKFDVIPLDFQTVVAGNPVIDLMYFIYTGSDGQFRKRHYINLIEYYYNELTAALRRLSVDISDVYPRKDYESDLKGLEYYGLLISVLILPIICVETEHAPDMGENSSFSEIKMVPSVEFGRRINDVVEDYITLGIL